MARPVVAWPSPDGLAPQVVAGPEAPPPARLGRPILMVVGAVGLFAAADVFAKQLSADFAALQVASKLGAGKRVVTVLPDTGERYLSVNF